MNIPEFVNIPRDGLMHIDVPAAESYRLFDVALDLTAKGELEDAIAEWKNVLELDPTNAQAQMNLGVALRWQGNLAEGNKHLQKAREIDPSSSEEEALSHSNYGTFFNREQLRAAIKVSDCDGVSSYGKEILATSPDDPEVTKALSKCVSRQNRQ